MQISHAPRSAHGISKIRLKLVGTPECTGFRIHKMQYKRNYHDQTYKDTTAHYKPLDSFYNIFHPFILKNRIHFLGNPVYGIYFLICKGIFSHLLHINVLHKFIQRHIKKITEHNQSGEVRV